MLSMSLVRGWLAGVLPLSFVLLAGSAHADEVEYTVVAKPVTLKVGQNTPLAVQFAPKAPWHWNKDYPAKLMLVAEGVTIARTELKQQQDDFKITKAGIETAFSLTAVKPGKTTGTLKGKIGLCDDKVCIIKKVELTVAMTATL